MRKGQIDNHHRPPGTAHHQPSVIDHLRQSHWNRCRVPLDDHPQAIADQQHIHPRVIQQAGHGEIVGGQHTNALRALLHFLQRLNRYRGLLSGHFDGL